MASKTDNAIRITSDQHVFIAGKTGSGKTTIAMFLLFDKQRLIVVDSKDSLVDWNLDNDSASERIKLKDGKPIRIRVVNRDKSLELMELAYESGDVIVYIDELSSLIPPQSKPPMSFNDMIQRGRSRNATLWTSTQRPTKIPLESISEATHFFIFRLNLERDRKTIADNAGIETLPQVKKGDDFGFYYYNDKTGGLRYFRRLVI